MAASWELRAAAPAVCRLLGECKRCVAGSCHLTPPCALFCFMGLACDLFIPYTAWCSETTPITQTISSCWWMRLGSFPPTLSFPFSLPSFTAIHGRDPSLSAMSVFNEPLSCTNICVDFSNDSSLSLVSPVYLCTELHHLCVFGFFG